MEKKRKKCEKLKNVLLFRHFTLEIFNGGVFLPITTTPKYSTTVPNSVNDTQDFMCIKFKALLPCKHHPIQEPTGIFHGVPGVTPAKIFAEMSYLEIP